MIVDREDFPVKTCLFLLLDLQCSIQKYSAPLVNFFQVLWIFPQLQLLCVAKRGLYDDKKGVILRLFVLDAPLRE